MISILVLRMRGRVFIFFKKRLVEFFVVWVVELPLRPLWGIEVNDVGYVVKFWC